VPDPDKNRRVVGCGCLGLGCLAGGALFLLELIGLSLKDSDAAFWSLLVAFVPVAIYLWLPALVDRYDPEPWWALAGVFMWGALFATGVSGIVNTIVAKTVGMSAAVAISAPIVEELTKGLGIVGVVIFLRKEFDGAVDGVIYGIFAGIGFAAVENVGYYFRFRESMGAVFVVRGILSPWLHPLFTAMTGLGFGLAREHGSTWSKVVFPACGYGFGVLLHAVWNGSSLVFKGGGFTALLVKSAIGTTFALAFLIFVIVLVVRKGRTIREFLRDEVLIGTITQQECDLICSPFGRIKASLAAGATGREFVRAGARLALSKWHTARAMKGQKKTISMDMIAPLRRQMATLRAQMNAGGG
jgi:RsiW-degrading membrane proteinase PrsW (M82 family)